MVALLRLFTACLWCSFVFVVAAASGCGESIAPDASAKQAAPKEQPQGGHSRGDRSSSSESAPESGPPVPGHAELRKLGVPVQGIEANAMNTRGSVVRLQDSHVTAEGTIREDVLVPLQEIPFLIVGIDGTAVTDAGLAQLAPFGEKIGSLSLISCQKITDDGMVHLQGLTRLESLFLNNTKITDAGLHHLRDLKSLKELNLYGTAITDDGLASLVGLENLNSLSLISCRKITDVGFKHLRNLKKLRIMWLINTNIGDAGLQELSPENPFEEVALNNTKVSSSGVDQFRKKFPDCVIVGR